jgi:hypothetical protein
MILFLVGALAGTGYGNIPAMVYYDCKFCPEIFLPRIFIK